MGLEHCTLGVKGRAFVTDREMGANQSARKTKKVLLRPDRASFDFRGQLERQSSVGSNMSESFSVFNFSKTDCCCDAFTYFKEDMCNCDKNQQDDRNDEHFWDNKFTEVNTQNQNHAQEWKRKKSMYAYGM